MATPAPTSDPDPGPRPRAATYRVQLRSSFTFYDAGAIAGYLAALGVSHLYCSPVLQAAAGSTHGYDVVDPGHLNTELGGARARSRVRVRGRRGSGHRAGSRDEG